jgi:hypothetical protein
LLYTIIKETVAKEYKVITNIHNMFLKSVQKDRPEMFKPKAQQGIVKNHPGIHSRAKRLRLYYTKIIYGWPDQQEQSKQ